MLQATTHNLPTSNGFSLVEVILSVTLFSLIMTALAGSFLYGQESTLLAGQRARAVFLAEEGLEATRNIRDDDFANLSPSTYGLAISGGNYVLSGSSDTVDVFTRAITVANVDASRKQITSNVTWDQNLQRTGSVSLVTYLTNWQDTAGVADCSVICQGLGYDSGICRQNPVQCTNNGETYESSGNEYCINPPNVDTCCCQAGGGGGGDTTAPSAITNLALSGATASSINLSWTASGDDGSTGTATSYDIRYSTSLISEANWTSATQATGEPSPSVAGSSESMTVSGLSSNTLYYFAIKTSDEVPNISTISNVPSLSTTAIPIATCAEYCQSLTYSTGTCRKNPAACNKTGETYESGGNTYCTGGASADTCCCLP